MIERYGKYDYQAAKQFLKDAQAVKSFETPTFSQTIYLKPDGTRWQEFDSKLEPPENDYSLELVKVS